MQEMWGVGVDWDDPLPSDVIRKVNSWFTDLEQLPNVKIPRSLQEKYNMIKVSLHTFCRCISSCIWSSSLSMSRVRRSHVVCEVGGS